MKITSWLVLLAAALPAAGAAAEVSTALTVRLSGFHAPTGEVAVALFDSAESYDGDVEPLRARFLPVEDDTCEWVVGGLPPGEYAVKAYHDLNGNRELDRGKLGIPKEPYGFSNDARAPFGPPSFAAARFEVGAEPRTVDVELRGGRRGRR